MGDTVVVSSHDAQASRLDILRLDQMNLSYMGSIDAKGEITCLGLFNKSSSTYIIAGSVENGIPCLTLYSLDGREVSSKVTQPRPGKFAMLVI